jgi:LCP family protein required for cell wall assembly
MEAVEQSATGSQITSFNGSKNSHSTSHQNMGNDPPTMPPESPQTTSLVTTLPQKGSSLAGWLFWGATFALTATISATVGATLALMVPLSPLIAPHAQAQGNQGFRYNLARPVNILVMGIDRVPDVPDSSPDRFNGRSDTMLLLRLDPTDHSVRMLSIPRDTRVDSSLLTIAKINQANADGGAALSAKVVSHTLNNIAIDRYVRVTTDAFRELVDLIGGVEVYVPERMSYVDNTQNLHIDLEQGWQTLNGNQAEQFARFRHDQRGDIGRVQRQQTLLKALRQRLQNPTIVPRLPQLIRVMWKYVDTNLSLEETLALASFGLGLQPDDVKMVMLPGRFSTPREYTASYWIMDSAGKNQIMHEYFGRESAEGSPSINRSPNRVRIAIQNATNQPRLADRVANELERKGFRNVYIVKDWPDPQQQTQIIVQKGDLTAATAVKRSLGFGKVEANSTGEISSDLTIRIGEDWQSASQ